MRPRASDRETARQKTVRRRRWTRSSGIWTQPPDDPLLVLDVTPRIPERDDSARPTTA
jgi:hypothetical protein